ncbi:DUF6269 family protein [Streptomyces sp. PTY087I2]|uniref:DUF6269 family protein n=1 Tax=Streptomyces sp. PTY087I2 TaxID=1819298 RepID=UPI00080B4E43|nr:DUF6269 family protein [Streptomyces sp. PTY087I2]OCC07773.1 hypothetical protein A3Q37_06442 [Streptomyces sp. PTY087I2]
MREDQNSPAQAVHPLEFLEEIEEKLSKEQEDMLPASITPWAVLLADYIDALSEIIARGQDYDSPAPLYALDQGHAGGCG